MEKRGMPSDFGDVLTHELSVCELLAAPVQGTMANRPASTVQRRNTRRSPRPSNSPPDVVDAAGQRTFRRAAPASVERRLTTSSTAATSRVGGPSRSAQPSAATRPTSPAAGTTHRLTARPNRSSDLRLARRDAAAASRPPGRCPSLATHLCTLNAVRCPYVT